MIQFVIPMNPITKKNSQRIVMSGRRRIVIPSEQYKRYEKNAGPFIKGKYGMIDYPVQVTALFYMEKRYKVDLTNLLEALDDILVKYGVLKDDNSTIIASHDGSRVLHDKANPRTEVTISVME